MMKSIDPSAPTNSDNQRCATIALLGIPNSGKSTLINSILGEKLAAVHHKPQMTRKNLLGIHTEKNIQLVFVDTPGIHENEDKLNQKMKKELAKAIEESDVVAVLLETNKNFPAVIKNELEKISKKKQIVFLINKIDLPIKTWKVQAQSLVDMYGFEIFPISALKEKGIANFIKYLQGIAPESPFFYDPDSLTTTTYRDLSADCIREKVMEYVHDEIPYQTAVRIEDYKETEKRIIISAVIIVNKESQKAIVIGHQGNTIQRIIKESHQALKKLTGCHVRVKIYVKVDQNWIKNDDKITEYS